MSSSLMLPKAAFAAGKKRARALPVSWAKANGYWLFGGNSEDSLLNRIPGGAQSSAWIGARTMADGYVEFADETAGFDSGILGGKPFTIILVATKPTVVSGPTSGIYGGHYNDGNNAQNSLQYNGTNTNLQIDFSTRANTTAYNPGTSFGIIAGTSDGSAGVLAYGVGGGVVTVPYTYTPDAQQYSFKLGAGRQASGRVHVQRFAAAVTYPVALTNEELAAEFSWLKGAMVDRGLSVSA